MEIAISLFHFPVKKRLVGQHLVFVLSLVESLINTTDNQNTPLNGMYKWS